MNKKFDEEKRHQDVTRLQMITLVNVLTVGIMSFADNANPSILVNALIILFLTFNIVVCSIIIYFLKTLKTRSYLQSILNYASIILWVCVMTKILLF